MVKVEPVPGCEYYMDAGLKKYLDKVKLYVNKKDKDFVLAIDGYEGAGKSTLGLQMAKYVDPSLDLSRVCLTSSEFKNAIITAKKGQCVVYDEAVTGMTAGDSLSRLGKLLKSMMMQMRQKNLFVIIIIPTFFELSKYAALSRIRGLFHVYEQGDKMGYWLGFNKKDTRAMYLKGKKSHSYTVKSRFRGRFLGKYPIDEEEYRKKKSDTLFLIDDEGDKASGNTRWIEQRDFAIFYAYLQLKTMRKVELLYKNCRFSISKSQIQTIIQETEKKYGKMRDIVQKTTPNM